MKRIFMVGILILLCVTSVSYATPPTHLWSRKVQSGQAYVNSVATDPSGNVFVTGYFDGGIDFGGGFLFSVGQFDIFLAKYDSAGNYLWAKRFGDWAASAVDVAVDQSGSVVITGYFYETVNFGGATLSAFGTYNMFLAKFDSNGVHQWSQNFVAYATSVAVDHLGNIVVTGSFNGTVNFGGSTLTSIAYDDLFIAKYNSNGVNQWSRRYFTIDYDQGQSIAMDGTGNTIVAGFLGTQLLLAKYDSAGAIQWSNVFPYAANQRSVSVAVDGFGNIFMEGTFIGQVNFGGGNLVSVGGDDVFLAKYDIAGAHQWSERLGGTEHDLSRSMVSDAYGNTFITASFANVANYGGGNLVSAGQQDIVLAKYDQAGAHVWSQRFGSTGNDEGKAVAVDNLGNVALTGTFVGLVYFGSQDEDPLFSPTSTLFVAKYSSDPAAPVTFGPIITSISDVGNDQGRNVEITFDRSLNDQLSSPTPVVMYEVYRRDDAPPSTAVTIETFELSKLALLDLGWVFVGDAPAHQQASYALNVPTIGDSTIALGQYYSVFFVRAATADQGVFFDSNPDSGYSIDNLAPGVPQNLVNNAGQLTWDESPAEDFDYFTVYGSNVNNIGSAVVVGHRVSPWMDVSALSYAFYFVTATDFAGNEGQPASLSILTGGEGPTAYTLSISNRPNPFNPVTTVSYSVPSRGPVTITIFDARGEQVATLVDNEDRAAGIYTVQWDGRTQTGATASSGVYFVRIVQNGAIQSRKITLLK